MRDIMSNILLLLIFSLTSSCSVNRPLIKGRPDSVTRAEIYFRSVYNTYRVSTDIPHYRKLPACGCNDVSFQLTRETDFSINPFYQHNPSNCYTDIPHGSYSPCYYVLVFRSLKIIDPIYGEKDME